MYLFFEFLLAGQGMKYHEHLNFSASNTTVSLVAANHTATNSTTVNNWSELKKNAPNVHYYINCNIWFYSIDIFFIGIVCGVSYVTGNRFLLKLATMPACLIETLAIGVSLWGLQQTRTTKFETLVNHENKIYGEISHVTDYMLFVRLIPFFILATVITVKVFYHMWVLSLK